MKQGTLNSKIVVLLLLAAVVLYLGVSAWQSFRDPFSTALTYSYTVDDSMEATGFLVRQEQVLTGTGGVVEVLPQEGEKVSRGGNLCIPVSELAEGLPDDAAFSMVLELESEGYSNRYRFWVYPSFAFDDSGVTDCSGLDFRHDSGPAEVAVVTAADENLKAMLDAGKRVILVPEHSSVTGNTVGGMFIPDFWNWSMFKTISENAGKEVSPGTLSIINDAAHPLFSSFLLMLTFVPSISRIRFSISR